METNPSGPPEQHNAAFGKCPVDGGPKPRITRQEPPGNRKGVRRGPTRGRCWADDRICTATSTTLDHGQRDGRGPRHGPSSRPVGPRHRGERPSETLEATLMSMYNPPGPQDRDTSDLVRSVALSSARLWEEVLERLTRVERVQVELAQSLSRMQPELLGPENRALAAPTAGALPPPPSGFVAPPLPPPPPGFGGPADVGATDVPEPLFYVPPLRSEVPPPPPPPPPPSFATTGPPPFGAPAPPGAPAAGIGGVDQLLG